MISFKVYFTSIILNYHLICQTVFIAAMSIGTCCASSIFRIVRWDFGWLVLCSNFREFNAVASSDESCKVFCENVVREDLGNAAGWLHQLLCFFFEFYPVISVTWATVKYMWFILDDELKERTLFYKFWSFFVFSRAMFTDSAEYIPIFRSTVLPRLAIIFMGAHAELSDSLQIIVTKVSINVFFGLNGRLDYGVP